MSRVERNQDTYKKKRSRSGGASVAGSLISFIGILILLASLGIGAVLTVPKIIHMQTYVVISGSMEPEIPVGSLVFSKECDPEGLLEGDVIVFYQSSGTTMPITHRVVENDTENREITTKGDANTHEDMNPALYENVIGKVVYHVPMLGYIASPISTPLGKGAMVMLIIAGYLLSEAGARLRREE